HLRCGDIISDNHPSYAWHKFGLLASHIDNSTKSIGIVTQPFEKHSNRKHDKSNTQSCKRLAGALVDYLKHRFTSARVSLRNNPDETVALAYSRMIVAKQVVVGGVSTFGVFAALASMGHAVIIAPDFPRAMMGPWMLEWERKKGADTGLVMVHDPHPLILYDASHLWWNIKGGKEAMIEWLTDDNFSYESGKVHLARQQAPPKRFVLFHAGQQVLRKRNSKRQKQREKEDKTL
ncbi:hypothetical protein ACHAWF_008969, partial [Thalassiosira exigua]